MGNAITRIDRELGNAQAPRSRARAGIRSLALVLALLFLDGCASTIHRPRALIVTATAYNSVPGQTQGHPSVGAWGDTLHPAIPSIAVSRDLVAMGLGRGTRVRIEGFERDFIVLDKMASKWRKRIDIHMGKDVTAARQWGKREVEIRWTPGEP